MVIINSFQNLTGLHLPLNLPVRATTKTTKKGKTMYIKRGKRSDNYPHATADDPYYQKIDFTTWKIRYLERYIREAKTKQAGDGFFIFEPSSPTDIAQAKKTLKEKLDAQS
tara:strand:- start:483 stop:815 length:333 start_codon:yes stop_codon:yes gene_type:complete